MATMVHIAAMDGSHTLQEDDPDSEHRRWPFQGDGFFLGTLELCSAQTAVRRALQTEWQPQTVQHPLAVFGKAGIPQGFRPGAPPAPQRFHPSLPPGFTSPERNDFDPSTPMHIALQEERIHGGDLYYPLSQTYWQPEDSSMDSHYNYNCEDPRREHIFQGFHTVIPPSLPEQTDLDITMSYPGFQSVAESSVSDRFANSYPAYSADLSSASNTPASEMHSDASGDVTEPELQRLLQESRRINAGVTENQYLQCPQCPKQFSRTYNLKSHLRTHTDERPHRCLICHKAFARLHDKRRHEQLHSGQKRFVCGNANGGWGCGRRFARADALGRHFRTESGRHCIRPLLEQQQLLGTDIEEALLQLRKNGLID